MSGFEDVAKLQDVAFAIVQSNGTIRGVRGCTVTRIGAGVYEATLDPSGVGGPEIATAGLVAAVGIVAGAVDLKATVQNTANNVKRVLIGTAAGVATDAEFSLTLSRLL